MSCLVKHCFQLKKKPNPKNSAKIDIAVLDQVYNCYIITEKCLTSRARSLMLVSLAEKCVRATKQLEGVRHDFKRIYEFKYV